MKHFIRPNWEVCPIRGVFFQTFWYNCSKKERNDSYLRKKISRKKRRALWSKPETRILGIAPYEGMHAAMDRAAQAYPNVQMDVFTGDLDVGVSIVQRMPPQFL